MRVWGGAGQDSIQTGIFDDWVHAGPGSDTVLSGSGDDELTAGSGDDRVWAGYGNDRIVGGFGDDELFGEHPYELFSGGDDDIFPGPGRDKVIGGPGNDIVRIHDPCELESGEMLVGGAGQDTLVTPLALAELQARGIIVEAFEQVQVEANSCSSECVDVPDCGEHGSCSEGALPGEVFCQCEERFAGEVCDECKPQFAGENCEVCSERFQGEECDQCRFPFTGDLCDECLSPFTGENCDECEYPWTGPNCRSCPDGTFGPDCDRCDPQDPNACSGHGECVDGPKERGAVCQCHSGHGGANCEVPVHEFSIVDNEGPSGSAGFPNHQLPDPVDLGERTVSATIDFELQPNGGNCIWSKALGVEKAGLYYLAIANQKRDNPWRLTLRSSQGEIVVPFASENYNERDPRDELSGSFHEFDIPQPGVYTAEVAADLPCTQLPTTQGQLTTVAEESRRVLYVNISTLGSVEGRAVGIQARVYDPMQEIGSPVSEGNQPAPAQAILGELLEVQLRVHSSQGVSFEVQQMFDDGLHGDELAGDGIYGWRVSAVAGLMSYEVQARGRSNAGIEYLRTGYGSIPVAEKTVKLLERGNEQVSFSPPLGSLQRVQVNIPLRPEDGDEFGDRHDFFDEWLKEELDVSAELWVVEQDDAGNDVNQIPIAYAKGPRKIGVEPISVDLGTYRMAFDLSFDRRWMANAGVLDLVDADRSYRFELRNVVLLDPKTQAVRENRRRVDVAGGDALVDWLDELPRGEFFDPRDSANEDMLTGASPEFVKDIESTYDKEGFPLLYGRIYLTSGWCGRVNMWEEERLVHEDAKDPSGARAMDRLIQARLWFLRDPEKGTHGVQVHVNTFADSMVAHLLPQPGIAQIFGYSQGGVAAMVARSRWTPLEAHRTDEYPSIQTLASEFYGTPGSEPGRFFPWLVRAIARKQQNCLLKARQGRTAESLGLGRIESSIRMSRQPRRVISSISWHRTSHRVGRFRWKGPPRYCHPVLSKVFLWGDDDGVVTVNNAGIPASLGPRGGTTWTERCHSGGWRYPFSPEDSEINQAMCNISLLRNFPTACWLKPASE